MRFYNLKTSAGAFATICLGLIFGSHLNAQNFSKQASEKARLNTITTAVPFLMIGPDARAGGMGDAGAASTPDANSIHWNPSKLAFIEEEIGFSTSYTPWLRALVPDINLAYLSFYNRLDNMQTIGASLKYFSLGDITFTDDVGNVIGQFKPNEFAFDVAYARKFSDRFSGGLALRYIYSNLTGGIVVQGAGSKPGKSVAADVSAYYQNEDLQVFQRNSVLGAGLNISNIGSKISYTESGERDFIPINMRGGVSLNIELDEFNTIGAISDFSKLLVPTPPELDASGNIVRGRDPNVSVPAGIFGSFTDAPGGFKEELKEFNVSGGLEYWYDKQFAVRAGYFYEHETKGNRKYVTLGAGLKYNVFGLDFSYLIPTSQRNPLENTLRFTLLFDFAGLKGEANGGGSSE